MSVRTGNPLQTTDIHIYYSSHTASGASYLGGPKSAAELSNDFLHNFFNQTTPLQMKDGITKFRCGYIYNSNPGEYIKNPILFVVSDTTSPNDSVSLGWGTSKIGNNAVGQPAEFIEQTIADQHTFPVNVSFFGGTNRNEGAILNADIPPLKGKAFWIKYNAQPGGQEHAFNNFRIRLIADNLFQDVPNPTGNPIPPEIEFPVIGEGSSDKDWMEIIKKIFARWPDFLITTGNANVNGNANFFISSLKNYVTRTLFTYGNIDVADPVTKNAYKNAFAKWKFAPNIVKNYYSKDFGNVHILVMDTSGQEPYTKPSDQYTFIEKDLKAAFTNPIIDWIIVTSHRAMYSSQTTSTTRFLHADLRDTYHELFTDTGVILFLQGTFRFFEMSKVLKYNPTTPTNPITFDYGFVENTPPQAGDRTYTFSGKKSFQDGFICVDTGTGGATHDVIVSPAPYSRFRNYINFGFFTMRPDNRGMNKKLITRYYATDKLPTENIYEVTFERKDVVTTTPPPEEDELDTET